VNSRPWRLFLFWCLSPIAGDARVHRQLDGV